MKFQTAPAANREIRVTVEPDPKTVNNALAAVGNRLGQTINIPGFRKGKVPYRVVERFLGREVLLEEAEPALVEQAVGTFVRTAGIGAVEAASLVERSTDPVTWTFLITLEPYVSLIDTYRDFRIEPQEIEPTDEEREEFRRQTMHQFGERRAVDRPAAWGDTLALAVRSVFLDEAGEPTDEVMLEDDDWIVDLDEEEPLSPPGLDDELLGVTAGQERTFVLSWPEDSSSVHAGRSVNFAISVKEVQGWVEAEWDAALLARRLGEEEPRRTLAEYEDEIWSELSSRKSAQVLNDELNAALESLEDHAVLEYGRVSLERQVQQFVEQQAAGLRAMGIRDLQSYLRIVGTTEEEFLESSRPAAERELKHNLLIWEFIEREKIELPAGTEERIRTAAEAEAPGLLDRYADDEQRPSPEVVAERLVELRLADELRNAGRDGLLKMATDGAHSLPLVEPAQEVDAESEQDAEVEAVAQE